MREECYDIGGMHCAACSAAVERVTQKLPGVESSSVNLTMARMTIVYDEALVTPEQIIAKITRAGFSARIHEDEKPVESSNDGKKRLILLIVSAVFAALLLTVSMGHMMIPGFPLPKFVDPAYYPVNFALLQMVLALPVIGIGYKYYTTGFGSLFHGNPNMNTLVAISSAASFIYSLVITCLLQKHPHLIHELYFESSAVVVALVSVGKYLEARSTEKTKSAISKLIKLAPDTATIVDENGTRVVPTSSIFEGDVLLVRAGEHIPLDGIISDGSGSTDESMITGESLPIEKALGDEVIGGSILTDGAVYVRVTRVGKETTLSKIISFVENAQGKKAPISKTADRVSGVFVPVVMGISTLAAVIWMIVSHDITFSIRIFTSILVIACPCAMGLATPTAIMVGTGLGAQHGILIRSGEALEIVHSVDTVVFDKTGTITEGKPSLTDLVSVPGGEVRRLYGLLFAVESMSDHPISRAVCNAEGVYGHDEFPTPSDLRNIPGCGLVCTVGSDAVLVGNARLMAENGVDISSVKAASDACRADGKTVIFCAEGGRLLGFAAVSDSIRPESANAVAKLNEAGIHTVLLTGDNKEAAGAIAKQAGISEVIAEVLPTEKADKVLALHAAGHRVMMVGDGINDAPALAAADVGVAIGSGSDIAIDSADVVLMRSDPGDVVKAIRLGRLTIRNIKQNLFWAFCYNVMAIPVAAGVLYPAFRLLLTPMIGGLAMSLSSLFVVTNALRLGRKKI